jgi:hypothetical protein
MVFASRVDEAVLEREQHRTGPGGHACLAVQVLDVVVTGFRGDPQLAADPWNFSPVQTSVMRSADPKLGFFLLGLMLRQRCRPGAALAVPLSAGCGEHADKPDGQAQNWDDGDDGQLACGKYGIRVHIGLLAITGPLQPRPGFTRHW